jgi:hypothetical protein
MGDEEMERNLGDWRWMNVFYECDISKSTNKKSGFLPQKP